MTEAKKSVLAETLSDIAKNVEEQRKHAAALRKHRRTLYRLLKPLTKAHEAGVLRYAPSVAVTGKGEEWWEREFGCTVTTVELDGFKDPRLVDLLSKLIDADDTKTYDRPASMNRDFVFRHRIDEVTKFAVTVCAYVKSDSPTCKKVLKKSTTRTIVDEEFELVCS